MSALRSVVLLLVFGAFLSGCAIRGSEFDVPVTPATKASLAPTKAKVAVVDVRDLRQFVIDPRSPYIPSLEDDDVDNKAKTERALGRKRDTYGRAGGNVTLPPGKTVSGLVAQVLEAALADKGYAVVQKGDDGYDTALPLSADIKEFWAWSNPGMAVSITFESVVALAGPWPVPETEREVSARAYYESYILIGPSDWEDLLNNGTADLRQNTEKVLK